MNVSTNAVATKEKPDPTTTSQDWRPGSEQVTTGSEVITSDQFLNTSSRVKVDIRPGENGSVEIVLTPKEGTKISTGMPKIDLKPLADLGREALSKTDFDWGNAIPPLIYSAGLGAGSMLGSLSHNYALSIPLGILAAAGVFVSFARGSKWNFD